MAIANHFSGQLEIDAYLPSFFDVAQTNFQLPMAFMWKWKWARVFGWRKLKVKPKVTQL